MNLKKFLILLLITTLCIPYIPSYIKADSSEEYMKIYTLADLVNINNNPRGNYILMNDIDMTQETKIGGNWDTGHGWTPLDEFSGNLDGNGYRIIGMHIYGEVQGGIGLFSSLTGSVKNLGMVNVNIDNVYQTYSYNEMGIGAIAGILWSGRIENCYVSGNITTTENNYVGGIAGYNFYNGKISNCYNTANVTGNGIIGKSGNQGNCSCVNCYNVGAVTGFGVSCEEYRQENTYNLQGKGKEYESTKTLTEAQMNTKSIYVGFDFETVWEIDPYSVYKYPQLKSNRHQRIEGFELVTKPDKTVYNQGENINISGGTVKIIYEDSYSQTITITNDMLTAYDMTEVGNQNIIVQYGGKKTVFSITVQEISSKKLIITGEKNIQKGMSVQLKASIEPTNASNITVTWSSSNKEIATVDTSGRVTAIQAGEAIIMAETADDISAKHTITVDVPCVTLTLNQSELTIYKGDTAVMIPKLSPIDTTDTVSWKSSNTNIVTVNNGKLLGQAAGETKVTASAGTASVSCTVIVKQKLDEFYIIGIEDKEYTGDELEQEIEVTDGIVILDRKTDYKISYSDNREVGIAKVHVMGIGYYEGSINKTFSIISKQNLKEKNKDSIDTNNSTINNTNEFVENNSNNTNYDSVTEDSSFKASIKKIKLSYVKNIKGKKLKLKFQAQDGANGYEIRYSMKPSMKSGKIKNTKNTNFIISSLKKKKKYYIQVRAYFFDDSGEIIYGKWSIKRSIIIKK